MNKVAMFLCIVCVSGQMARADDAAKKVSPMKMPTMTSEQRQKMADAHEKMSVCLRSDKPMGECHEEMMKACQEGMGKEGCPMMGAMGMHHGHMKHSDKASSKSTE